MKYNITTKKKTPKMPSLGKGTKCIKLLLSEASKDMYTPLITVFSLFIAHTSAMQNFSILSLPSLNTRHFFQNKWHFPRNKWHFSRNKWHEYFSMAFFCCFKNYCLPLQHLNNIQ